MHDSNEAMAAAVARRTLPGMEATVKAIPARATEQVGSGRTRIDEEVLWC